MNTIIQNGRIAYSRQELLHLDSTAHFGTINDRANYFHSMKQKRRRGKKGGLREKMKSAIQKNKFKIMNVNCRSLISHDKQLQLEQLIQTHEPDIILATETHLDDTIDSKTIFNPNYLDPPPYRKDRRCREGGVLIAVNSNITSVEKETVANCEVVWCKVSPHMNSDIFIGCFYRQPNNKVDTLNELRESLKQLHNRAGKSTSIILAGDFNVPDIKWDTLEIKQNPQYGREVNETIIDIVTEFNLTQVVQGPTRENNTLDIILTSNPDLMETPQIHPGMSDHDIVLCNVNGKINLRRKPPRTILLFQKGNMNAIKQELNDNFNDFTRNVEHNDTNENWEHFKTLITELVTKHIPTKTISGKPNLPWITNRIKRLIRKKQKLYNTAKRNQNEQDWKKFKELRKCIHKELRDAHNKYVYNLLDLDPNTDTENHTHGITKRFWSYIRSKRRDTSGISVLKRENGTDATEAVEKANILNRQYQSVFTNEDTNLPTMAESTIPTMPRIVITTQGITKLLMALDPRKAGGPDEIPTRVLKEAAKEIAPYLCVIFQKSLNTGCVPEDWKHAKITAIFKKGKRDIASNYRPVSLTSVSCKILEHIIFHSVMNHLEENEILVNYQHGFRKSHSCETQLITTLESISKSLDEKKQVDLIILDFCKAFDTVPHNRLLQKLQQIGLRNIEAETPDTPTREQTPDEQLLLNWFKNWLCGRTQQVILEGQSSTISSVLSGVPQGTVLGPLCFLIFINDLGKDISSQTQLRLFADDSLLFREITNDNDTQALQEDLHSLMLWAKRWHMTFNPSKCYIMRITNKKNIVRHEYSMHNTTLQHVENNPYLGVQLNRQLKWGGHINHTVSKANKTLGFLMRNLYQCPQRIKAQAYTALVRPILEYASSAWDPHHQKDIDMLEKVQRKAARFATNCRSREEGSVTRALRTLNWKPLEQRRKEKRLTQLYKTINGYNTALTIPDYFKHQNNKYRETRSYHESNFIRPICRTDAYHNSFYPRTIRQWNNLPRRAKYSLSVDSFKNSCID